MALHGAHHVGEIGLKMRQTENMRLWRAAYLRKRRAFAAVVEVIIVPYRDHASHHAQSASRYS